MSDKTKSQLLVECERLKRELAEANRRANVAEQIQHAEKAILIKEIEEHTKTKAENARLAADNLKRVLVLEKELTQAKARLNELEPLVGSPACQKYLETLQSFDELKAENARLAAQNAVMRESIRLETFERLQSAYKAACRDSDPNQEAGKVVSAQFPNDATALCNLLAPTIELLEQLTYPAVSGVNNELVHKELARLRSLLPSNETSEKVVPCSKSANERQV